MKRAVWRNRVGRSGVGSGTDRPTDRQPVESGGVISVESPSDPGAG